MTRRLLILDDEPGVLNALQRTLRRCFPHDDLRIETHTDPEQALLRCGEATFDVVMSDHHMPGFSGVDFLHMVKHIQPQAVRMVLSGSTDDNVIVRAVDQAEVFRYLAKPWTDEDIRDVLELAFARAAQLRASAQARPLTPQEREAQRLEREEPGITQVNWRPDGSIDLGAEES